jgi:DNA-binding beta-propeller fold protein YncE
MKKLWILALGLAASLAGGAVRVVQDQCGPFNDVTPAFCPYILELYYLGVTAGTSATTFSPDDPLTRGQGSVFVAKGLNQALARSSRRAALGQWWTTTPRYDVGLGSVSIPNVAHVASDGVDLWAAGGSTVYRVRASDGRVLDTWTAPSTITGILVAMGRVFATSFFPEGTLSMLDPTQPGGAMTTVATLPQTSPYGMAFDGSRIWVTNQGQVSIVTPASTIPWPVTNVSTGFDFPFGALYDGTNVWITDRGSDALLRVDSNGAIVQSIPIEDPQHPVFDGANIWVPGGFTGTVVVVEAATGAVRTSLTGIPGAFRAVFDGQRVLVTNLSDGVALWQAADLTSLGLFSTGFSSMPGNACSDGKDFWIALGGSNRLARF